MRKQGRRLGLQRLTVKLLTGVSGGITGVRSYHEGCSGSCDTCDENNQACWTGASCDTCGCEPESRDKAGC